MAWAPPTATVATWLGPGLELGRGARKAHLTLIRTTNPNSDPDPKSTPIEVATAYRVAIRDARARRGKRTRAVAVLAVVRAAPPLLNVLAVHVCGGAGGVKYQLPARRTGGAVRCRQCCRRTGGTVGCRRTEGVDLEARGERIVAEEVVCRRLEGARAEVNEDEAALLAQLGRR